MEWKRTALSVALLLALALSCSGDLDTTAQAEVDHSPEPVYLDVRVQELESGYADPDKGPELEVTDSMVFEPQPTDATLQADVGGDQARKLIEDDPPPEDPAQADPPPEDIPLESQPDPLPTEAPPQEDIPPAEEHPVEIPPAEEAPTDTPPAEEPQVEIRTDEL